MSTKAYASMEKKNNSSFSFKSASSEAMCKQTYGTTKGFIRLAPPIFTCNKPWFTLCWRKRNCSYKRNNYENVGTSLEKNIPVLNIKICAVWSVSSLFVCWLKTAMLFDWLIARTAELHRLDFVFLPVRGNNDVSTIFLYTSHKKSRLVNYHRYLRGGTCDSLPGVRSRRCL